jgi:DNA-binding NarL/FixJ family response regulator
VARALLQLEGFAVVGGAADALSALDAVGRLRPDVVVLDIQLPTLTASRSPAAWLRPGTRR